MSLYHFLIGTWFICCTNFPMWTQGNKTNPTFNYGLVPTKNGQTLLSDEVRYLQKGKQKSIKGFDYPDAKNPDAYTWRGKGLLHVLRSRWQIVLKDPQEQWAVIHFSKTLFTPEGMDIISRTQKIDPETLKKIKAALQRMSFPEGQLESLQEL
jgi:hypothetical protein